MGIDFGLYNQSILIEGGAQGKGDISSSVAGSWLTLTALLPERVPFGRAVGNYGVPFHQGKHGISMAMAGIFLVKHEFTYCLPLLSPTFHGGLPADWQGYLCLRPYSHLHRQGRWYQ